MSYISLHNHTCFSLMDGYQTVQELVGRAKELGMSAISQTEHGTMSEPLSSTKSVWQTKSSR